MNELKDYIEWRDDEGPHQLINLENHEENKHECQLKNEFDVEEEWEYQSSQENSEWSENSI